MWKQIRPLAVGVIVTLTLVACTSAPTEGPITIVTQIDFSSEPFSGTFEVTEGANILGCSAGSFVDTPTQDEILKLMTCDSGSKSGTFTIEFNPFEEGVPWSIFETSDDFAGLSGTGEFALEQNEAENFGFETFTGEIEYAP